MTRSERLTTTTMFGDSFAAFIMPNTTGGAAKTSLPPNFLVFRDAPPHRLAFCYTHACPHYGSVRVVGEQFMPSACHAQTWALVPLCGCLVRGVLFFALPPPICGCHLFLRSIRSRRGLSVFGCGCSPRPCHSPVASQTS